MIRIIAAGVTIECEISDVAAVLASVNPTKVPETVPEPIEVPKTVKILTCEETFASWNIGDMTDPKLRRQWYGADTVKIGTYVGAGGFFGFLAFLRTRNPGRIATRMQMWTLFRFMPWTHSTFVQNLYLARHQHGWTYNRENAAYVANK